MLKLDEIVDFCCSVKRNLKKVKSVEANGIVCKIIESDKGYLVKKKLAFD